MVACWTVFCLLVGASQPAATTVNVGPPDGTQSNGFYVGNRAPLAPSPFIKLPVGAVRPRGWLRTELQLQADGYSGHLTEISAFLKKEKNAWLSPDGSGDHGWEEVPYWLKGFANIGYLLDDQRILDESKVWIEAMIRSQKADGWFGPDEGRTAVAEKLIGRDDLWPNMIALFCLQDYYEYSNDPRVLELMSKYFRWELGVPDEKFLIPFWQEERAADNLASVYWLYNRTGEPWLLELGEKIFRTMARLDERVTSWHNVNIAQSFDSPAIYWLQSHNPAHLAAAERNWQEVRRLYGQVPGGMFGGDENCRPGYSDPRQAIETCGVVEEMLSDEQLILATGNLVWADRCENACFNSLPATTTPDLKALRYLTAPNQPISDRVSKAPGIQNGGPMYLMDPHDHRCCQHNSAHGWPYFVEHLFFATPGNGLAAVMYGPSEVRAKVGDGTEVTLTETTDYPFDETVTFKLAAAKPVRFPLYLRVPGWCAKPAVTVNGESFAVDCKAGAMLAVERQWADGDQVVLQLPMPIQVVRWEHNANSASVVRGPLTYSLKIGEKYVRQGGTDAWPAWEILPTTPWNYGLVLDPANPAGSLEVVRGKMPEGQPFVADGGPIELRARGKRIPNWKLDSRNLVETLIPSPVRSDEPVEEIRLVPMGGARIRISAFPVIGEGADARPWPEDRSLAEPVSASHCFESDTVQALNDGAVPKDSNDHSIPRMTWWPELGSTQWVQYRFDAPRRIAESEVYWFDDTGAGKCRVPASWRLVYLDGKEWKPVRGATAYRIERDGFNRATFEPVTTSAIRLEAQLQPEFSGGILEWRVK